MPRSPLASRTLLASRSQFASRTLANRCRLTPSAIAFVIVSLVAPARAQGGLDLETVIQTTLDRNLPILESIESTRAREAEVLFMEGAFDLVVGFSAEGGRTSRLFSDSEQSIYDVSSASTGVSNYRLAVARRTRSGITISPVLEFTRRDALTLPAPPIVRTEASFQISYPILNAGRRIAEVADLASARHAFEGSIYEALHVRSASVHRVAVAYWAYLGAFESLEIQTDSEAKAHRLLEETRALVDGGERPASDLDQLRADLADRFAARLIAEQRLFEAREQLGMEMGLRSDEAAALPKPSSRFPVSRDAPTPVASTALEAIASKRRADLAGIEKAVAATAETRYARSIEARPLLDLRFSIGYAGLSENRLTIDQHLPPFGQNHVSGTNGSLSLVLEWPVSNRRARGMLERQDAAWRQAQIARDDLERRIHSGLKVASEQLRSSIAELAKVEEAVELYAAAVENERKKLQLGMSTQFDLILVEERLRNSLLARVAARVRYAGAIVRLRFEAGTLTAEPDSAREIANSLLSPAIEID